MIAALRRALAADAAVALRCAARRRGSLRYVLAAYAAGAGLGVCNLIVTEMRRRP